jgi:hypothetical protein
MRTFIFKSVVGSLLALSAVAMAIGAAAADPIVGTWTMNAAKSTFSPGPALKSQTRVYTETADGISLKFDSVAADGTATSGASTFKYDGKDYAMSGSPDYDTLVLKRVNAMTVNSTQKMGKKVIGHAVRTVSKDGKVMTLASTGKSANGKAFKNVMVFDRN